MHGYHLTVQHFVALYQLQQQVICTVQNVRGRCWCDHGSRVSMDLSMQ
jgi:hypothetical protein